MKRLFQSLFLLTVAVPGCGICFLDAAETYRACGIVQILLVSTNDSKPLAEATILIQFHDPDTGKWVLSGKVYDQSGHPDAGTVLRVWEGANIFLSVSSSDADGRYKLRREMPFNESTHPPLKSLKALLLARDLDSNLVSVCEINGAISNLDVHLIPACSLSGRVQDSDGKPLTNAAVSLDLTLTSLLEERAQLEGAANSTDGHFSFRALPQRGKFSLKVEAAGYGSFSQDIKFAKHGESINLPTIVLNPANLQVAGKAVTADGKPAPGVRVVATGQDQMAATSLITDSRGHFAFSQVAKGLVTISGIVRTNYDDVYACNPYVYTQGGETNVLLRLVAPVTHGALEAWQAGDKQAAILHFLDADWSNGPLFDPYRTLSLSEKQFDALSDKEREARGKEIIRQVESLRKLIEAVFEAGNAAAAKGDNAQARRIFLSLKQCGTALGNPDCLSLLQIVGKGLEKRADAALHNLEMQPGN